MSLFNKEKYFENIPYIYSIRILIRHPSIIVDEITKNIGMEPDFSWNFNDPGRQHTMWSLVNWTKNERFFFRELGEVIVWLEERSHFLKKMNDSGGTISLIVQLSGKLNIGDELPPEMLIRAAQLGTSIGVEVFPNFAPDN